MENPNVHFPCRKKMRLWLKKSIPWLSQRIKDALGVPDKIERYAAMRAAKSEVLKELGEASWIGKRKFRQPFRTFRKPSAGT